MAKLLIVCLLLACAAQLSAQVPEILYLKLNSPSGTITSDRSVPGLPNITPTLMGSAGWNTTSPKIGTSAYQSTYPQTPTSTDGLWTMGAITVSSDWTIELWANRNYYGGFRQTLFSIDSVGLKVLWDPDHNYRAMRVEGPFSTFYFQADLTMFQWHHVALVHDAETMTLTPYFDGLPQGQQFMAAPVYISGTPNPGLILGNSLTSGAFGGSLDEFRIWGRAKTTAEIQASMNTQFYSWIQTDMTISNVVSPVYVPRTYALAGSAEVVTAEVESLGLVPIPAGTMITMSYELDGGTPVVETVSLPSSLTAAQRYVHSFQTTADLSQPGHHEIKITVALAGDQDPSNDSHIHSYGAGDQAHLIDVFPWTEDFLTAGQVGANLPPPNWIQEDEGGVSADFQFHAVSISGDGPPTDHTTGSPSYGTFATASVSSALTSGGVELSSPLLDTRAMNNPRLRFWAWIDSTTNPTSPGSLSVDVIQRPSGIVVQDVWGPVSNIAAEWTEVQVDLSAFAGQAIQIRFRASSTHAAPSQNISIDDVFVYDHLVGIGQPPRPGIAEFNLNGALNVGLNPIETLENGPYFSSVTPGDVLTFDFAGAANVPIILCYGPLNPQAATFGPAIGQLDIGGAVDPATGIPTGLGVLFNGNNSIGLDYFFKTAPTGATSFQTQMPPLPPGVLTTFQAALFDPAAGVLVCSNAIELSVN